MCYADFFFKLQTSVATGLEKVKVANHFTTGYIYTKIKTCQLLKDYQTKKNYSVLFLILTLVPPLRED